MGARARERLAPGVSPAQTARLPSPPSAALLGRTASPHPSPPAHARTPPPAHAHIPPSTLAARASTPTLPDCVTVASTLYLGAVYTARAAISSLSSFCTAVTPKSWAGGPGRRERREGAWAAVCECAGG